MAKDDADRIFFQCFSENDSWIGNSTGYATFTDDLKMIDLIGPVQKKYRKYFMAVVL